MASQNGYLICQIQIWIPSESRFRNTNGMDSFMEGESRQWQIQYLQIGAKVEVPRRVGCEEGSGALPQNLFSILV